jgi:hypothetical protein
MIKKYLPHILLTASLIVLMVLLTEIQAQRDKEEGILKLPLLIKAVSSILLMSFGIVILLKRN